MIDAFKHSLEKFELEQLDTYLFRYSGKNAGIQRIYGGQVIAQAYIAACATVEDDSAPHSLHAYFIRPGVLKQPVLYSVDPIRNGKSFHTRTVKAIQNNEVIFTMTISFQKAEEGITHTVAMPDVPQPEDLKTEQELRKSNIDNIPKELQEIFLKEREYSIKWVEWNDVFDPKKILIESNNTLLKAQQIRWRYAKIYHNIFINNFVKKNINKALIFNNIVE